MLQQYLPLAVLKHTWVWRILIPANKKVATVLTACGIETLKCEKSNLTIPGMLQQYLPLAVLKRIEELEFMNRYFATVATVLTACGIETVECLRRCSTHLWRVATVLTACGIETTFIFSYLENKHCCNSTYR